MRTHHRRGLRRVLTGAAIALAALTSTASPALAQGADAAGSTAADSDGDEGLRKWDWLGLLGLAGLLGLRRKEGETTSTTRR